MRLLRATFWLILLVPPVLLAQHSPVVTAPPAASPAPSAPTSTSAAHASVSPSPSPSPSPSSTHTQPSARVEHESGGKHPNAVETPKNTTDHNDRLPARTEKIKTEKNGADQYSADKRPVDMRAVNQRTKITGQGEHKKPDTKQEIKQEKKDRKDREKLEKKEKRKKDKKDKKDKAENKKEKKELRAALKRTPPPCSAGGHRQCICAHGALSDKTGHCSGGSAQTAGLSCFPDQVVQNGVCWPARQSRQTNNCQSLAMQLERMRLQLLLLQKQKNEACSQDASGFQCIKLTQDYQRLELERQELQRQYDSCRR